MARYEDLTGQKFGRLTVKSLDHIKSGNAYWLCSCSCGNSKIVAAIHLKSGSSKSCGCLKKESGLKNQINLRNKEAKKKAIENKIKKDGLDGTMISSLTRKVPANNKSGIKGVRWEESRKKWCAYITIKQKHMFLGRFSKKEDAIKARKEAEEKYFKPLLDKKK